MTQDLWAAHRADLAGLRARDRWRALAPRRGHDFASNDYLALSDSPRLRGAIGAALARGVPAGSGGSRLLRGNDPEHEALEAEAAAWAGCESALFLSSGYAANVALLATLPQRWRAPHFPLRASDFIARGIAEGPALGHVLTLAEDAWLAANFPLDPQVLSGIADQTVSRFTRDHRL